MIQQSSTMRAAAEHNAQSKSEVMCLHAFRSICKLAFSSAASPCFKPALFESFCRPSLYAFQQVQVV